MANLLKQVLRNNLLNKIKTYFRVSKTLFYNAAIPHNIVIRQLYEAYEQNNKRKKFYEDNLGYKIDNLGYKITIETVDETAGKRNQMREKRENQGRQKN